MKTDLTQLSPYQRALILSCKRHTPEQHATRINWPWLIFWALYLGFFSWLGVQLWGWL